MMDNPVEHTSFFAENGWAITAGLVFILGILVTVVGFFVRRYFTGIDGQVTSLTNSVNRIDRVALKLETSVNAQHDVCKMQHKMLDRIMETQNKRLDDHDIKLSKLDKFTKA